MPDPAAGADPGFEALTLDWLRAKPGAKWHKPQGLLAAWVADMDVPPAPVIVDALRARLELGDLGYADWGYPHPVSPAVPLFVERAARRYGWQLDPAEMTEWCEVVQAVQMALHLTCQPGDGVVLHTPSYPPLWRSIADMGLRQIDVPAAIGHAGVVFDHDALAARLEHEQARVLLLCNPQNPTGHCFTRPELERLVAIAERHDLLIISDEIHADLVHAPHAHVPIASISPAAAARTVTVHSASKAFNLAGMRHAVAQVGPAWLRERIRALPDHLTGAISLLAAEATCAAWRDGDDWLAAVLAQLDANRHLLADLLAEHLPDVRYRVPESTYLAWLDCRACGFDREPVDVFRDRGVELSPGLDFGPSGAGWVRLNMATSGPMLERIVTAMATV